jgi:hypothetical protein
VEGYLVDAVLHRGNTGCRRVPGGGVHLVGQLLH